MSATSMVAYAIEYATVLNVAVFPICPRTKLPYEGSHAHLDASTDPDVIADMWRRRPGASIGISCIGSGLVTLDNDPRSGGPETLAALERKLGPLPRTWAVLTGGIDAGTHHHFRQLEDRQFRKKAGDGVDIKRRGYTVAPPSPHKSGRRYEWDVGWHPFDACPAAELPPAWLDALTVPAAPFANAVPFVSSNAYAKESLEQAYEAVLTAAGGNRNDTLSAAAWKLARFVTMGALSEVEVTETLASAAAYAGLSERETRRTIASALRARRSV